jgi:nicotinamidase-related amidase
MNDMEAAMTYRELPVPPHFNPDSVGEVWRVPYQDRAAEAERWGRKHAIRKAYEDAFKLCLIAVDVQNTFCIPGYELYVAGRSGTGAVDDNKRLSAFIYRNMELITEICPTMDTHQAMQIFHAFFFVNDQGEHPEPLTVITVDDVRRGRWQVNPEVARSLGVDGSYAQQHLVHYTEQLKETGKYELRVWPYHGMLGGISHALVSAVAEAVFFHGIARCSRPDFEVKGENPFTEHYSVIGPEVLEDPQGRQLAEKTGKFLKKLQEFDAVVIAGQAKSHCVAWSIDDLLGDLQAREARLAEKVYLLEDCTSPVVVPGVVDYTEKADAAFERFSRAGMHIVRSTDPISTWPGIGP